MARWSPGAIAAGLITLAPPSETSSTTPKPDRSGDNHRCKPRRENAQAKGAATRKRGVRRNSEPGPVCFRIVSMWLGGELRSNCNELLQATMGVGREPSERETEELIFGPSHCRNGDFSRPNLFREPERQHDFISRLDRRFGADPRSPLRQIVDQTQIDGRPP